MTGSIPPPPGWHPDPSGEKVWRWWDGNRWTEHAADPTAPDPAPAGAGGSGAPSWFYPPRTPAGWRVPSAHDALAAEESMAPWAKRAFVWYMVVIATGLLLAWAESSSFRQVFHEIRVQASTGVTQPRLTSSVRNTDLLSLVTLIVTAPFYVLVLIWQFRAAKTARLLSLSATHSAGLGVGSWFIPVVNFWFPYQSLRDCLPPGHPDRGAVARMWACFIAVLIVNLITQILVWVGSQAGFVSAAVALALGLGFALNGVRTVGSIATAHRRLLGLE